MKHVRSVATISHGVMVAAICLRGAAPALAQQAQSAPAADQLEEVIVTATRFESSVDKVPMSISAVTQDDMVAKGIVNARDLARVVPGLTMTGAGLGGGGASAVSNIAIRGVRGSSGAATTGLYLNDTPLQRRFTTSAFQINGSPTPPMFDVQRVEVLRGPQGTLYGGSSLGGTVRFITPTPSLTDYSVYARAQGNHTEYGGNGYEIGVAGGGPILDNRLGFRVSAYTRSDAGYIDLVDPFNDGAVREKDVNKTQTSAFQAALRAAFTDQFSGTLSWYKSRIDAESDGGSYNLPVSGTVSLRAPSLFGFPSTQQPYTFGDMSYLSKPFQSFDLYKSPNVTELMVPSLTLLYETDHFSLQSSTSYIDDDSVSTSYDSTWVGQQNGVTTAPGGVTGTTGVPYSPYITSLVPFWTHSYRTGWSQELRFTTSGDGPVSLVAGLYGAKFKLTTDAYQLGSIDTYTVPTIGLTGAQICTMFGFFCPQAATNTPAGYGTVLAGQTNKVEDTEFAAYGEATYHATPKLNFIGGVRVSRVKTSYSWFAEGQIVGEPTAENGNVGDGSQQSTPVTPKVEVQYKFADDRMLYALAAKAFRPGGVNQSPIHSICDAGLASVGLTSDDLPKSYGPDTVWSYEIGAKMRVTPSVQWNVSVYRIDWSNIQLDSALPRCGQSPTVNAGKAVSQGFDTDLTAVFFGHLTANLSLGYDDAYYSQTAYAISYPNALPTVQAGDRIPVPVWTGALGLNYGFNLTRNAKGYVRGDYQYTGSYENSPRFGGTAEFNPDTRNTPSGHVTNVRLGAIMGQFDVSLFADNVFNDRPNLSGARALSGRTVCSPATGAACTSYTTYNPFYTAFTYRPLTYGLQVVYRL